MMRLIDADEMLENESEAYMKAQQKCDGLTANINKAVHAKIQLLIIDTPTAYDVGKVVGLLEKLSDEYMKKAQECATKGDKRLQAMNEHAAFALMVAVNKVKAGGVNE